jgi:hypothetical protein
MTNTLHNYDVTQGNCEAHLSFGKRTNTLQVKLHRIIVKLTCHFVSQMILLPQAPFTVYFLNVIAKTTVYRELWLFSFYTRSEGDELNIHFFSPIKQRKKKQKCQKNTVLCCGAFSDISSHCSRLKRPWFLLTQSTI